MRLAQSPTFGFDYKCNNENDIILPPYSACNRKDCDSFYAMGIIFTDAKKYYHNLEVNSATRYKLWNNNSWSVAQHQTEGQTLSQYLCINLLCNNSNH